MTTQTRNKKEWWETDKPINPFLLTDGYKVGHHQQYPDGTSLVYSNFTPRSNKYAPKGCNQVVVFGTQMTMIRIHILFKEGFFDRPKDEVCQEIKKEYSLYLGTDYDVSHIERLHDLGYLPVEVKALEEGTLVNMRIPMLTIKNTLPDFYWITNFLETILSNLLWKPMTSATIAHAYRNLLTSWQQKTDAGRGWFIDWQGHDFSMRGLDSIDATISSGLGHATSFMGSDSLPVIHGARIYYGAEGAVVGSVNATEHSVMCAGKKDDEVETFRRLLRIYPTGILSVVSDTWDLWKVCTEHIVTLKEEILARDGKLVIRPDSGDPVDIICGLEIGDVDFLTLYSFDEYGIDDTVLYNGSLYKLDRKRFQDDLEQHGEWVEDKDGMEEYGNNIHDNIKQYITKLDKVVSEAEIKGVVELLWDVFGGEVNAQGYKVLDSHIGAIYGDSITLERAEQICQRLEAKGFASTNVVLGVGSFTYQYNTRDTFGFAMKATYVEITQKADEDMSNQGGPSFGKTWVEGREIFKDPVTDDGTKKSATGLLKVIKNADGEYELLDKVSIAEEKEGELKTIYIDGTFPRLVTFDEIRKKLIK